MANAHVVVTGSTAHTPKVGKVFDDIKFFLVQRIPSRSRFVGDIEANGGRVVKVESQADYVIADHMRKDAPAGSYSYTLIEAALRDGRLHDSSDHAIRPPDAVREVGSTAMGRTTRTPFTPDDDKLLWNWVEQARAAGDPLKGNAIYKALEAVNPRHTHQSWRDRYVKYLSVRPPPGVTVSANPPPTPPIVAAEQNETPPAQEPRPFTDVDFDKLMLQASDIELIGGDQWEEAWEAFAKAEEETPHTGEEWASFYWSKVRPVYLKSVAGEGEDHKERMETNQKDSEIDQEPDNASKKRKQRIEQQFDSRDRAKRQKTATPELNERREHEPARNEHMSDMPTTELPERLIQNMASKAIDVLDNAEDIMKEPIITSDLNAAANMQLQQEADVNGVDRLPTSQSEGVHFHNSHTLRSEATVPTPEANRAAAAQFGDWRASDDNARHEDGDIEDEREARPSDETQLPPSEPQLALTAENLASQQAQHEPPLTRGTDLPKDDDDADQTNYAEYLSQFVGQNAGHDLLINARSALSAQGQGQAGGDSDMLDEPAPAHNPPRNAETRAPLPLSSPQEIDEAFENGFRPASPSQRRRPDVEPGQNFQPRSMYPSLHSQPGREASEVDDAAMEDPAEALMSQINRPTSSDRRGSGSQPDFEEIFRNDDVVEVDEDQDRSQGDGHIEDGEYDDYDDLDLSMPEPEGGFDSPDREDLQPGNDLDDQDAIRKSHSVIEISSHESSSPYTESSRGSQQPWSRPMANGGRSHAVDTQDIINAETQKLDLELPLPMSSDDELGEHVTVQPRNTTARDEGKSKPTAPEVLDTPEQVKDWVSTMALRGYKKGAVVKALKSTSMRPDLALLVLIEQKAGKGFPADVSGVWTKDEDTVLESGNAQGIEELEKKHGWEEMAVRMKFLEDWRTLG
ncbi:hypothetical protein M409DRAFT_16987 [Zasmidium cellare ATCC 36951]|uniref:DNA-binding protein RAP1 n=1 Tax=Zasmidium cellare ATCC 36951 TaxID=1080233 RepID=A0A6A6D0P5_ZASCE|nr:uncharacterized protein M409DRAFT_16987 [Zasmidium cellare ATCC 36951]KAF2173037.1 hypothetical protein M409DRAFT_16987 [Zasmidium cellare ATCC 36951]